MGEPYEQYVFLPAPPAEVESGLFVLKVEVPPGDRPRDNLASVRVLEVQTGEWDGSTAQVWLPPQTSCSRWIGSAEAPLYVVGRRSAASGRVIAREYRLHQLRGFEDRWDGTVIFNP